MKTLLLNVTILLALQVSISGCMEMDFESTKGSVWPGGPGVGGYDFLTHYSENFWLDSAVRVSDSTATLWAHISFDSVMIIGNRSIEYSVAPEGEWISEVVMSVPDTIDFRELPDSTLNWQGRKEWIYKYSVSVDSLKSGVGYVMCIMNDYVVKSEMRFESCNSLQMN